MGLNLNDLLKGWRRDDLKKPLVLIFPFGYLSHYLRCIVLARMLKEECEVLFLANKKYRSFLEKEGFKSFVLDGWDEAEALEQMKRFDFSWLNDGSLEKVFSDLVKVLNQYRPVLVIGDNYPCLSMAAGAANISYASVLNGYMSKYYSEVRSLSKRHPGYPVVRLFPVALRDFLITKGEEWSFRKVQRPFNRIRRKYSLPEKASYLDELEGDFNLICDLPGMFPQRGLPAYYHIVGPLVYDEPVEVAGAPAAVDPRRKTLFVNLGSTGDWDSMAFLKDPYYRKYNIVTAGDDQEALASLACVNFAFVSAAAILPFADLVICHGGNGIVNQCLQYGVPMLCRTVHFEQEWNVGALERVGKGRSIDGINSRRRLREIIDVWISRT